MKRRSSILLLCILLSGFLRAQNILSAEYFFDTDPGPGNGIQLTIAPDTAVDATVFISLSALAAGHHTLYLRTIDANGFWSIYSSAAFFIYDPNVANVAPSPAIIGMEYFIDNDRGAGNGTAITINPGDSIEKSLYISTTGMDTGMHFIYLRSKDAKGNWGIATSATFSIYQVDCILPVADFSYALVNFGNPVSFTNLTTQTDSATTYEWDIGNDSTIDFISQNIALTFDSAGSYEVKLTATKNDSCYSSVVKNVLVGPVPDTSIQITGSAVLCEGSSVTLAAASGFQYLWSTGETTRSITVTTAANYYVRVTGVHNFSRYSEIIRVTVNRLPEYELMVFHAKGGNANGSAIAVAGNNFYAFHWSNNQTTSAVTGLSAGTYYVTVTNGLCSVVDTAVIQNLPVPVSGIFAAEYFFDTDPGVGNGLSLQITQGDSVNHFDYITATGLTLGVHYLFVRVMDISGTWSITKGQRISVYDTIAPIPILPSLPLSNAEYFFDTDPGPGEAGPINISIGDSTDMNFQIPVAGLSSGYHELFIRTKDQIGNWGLSVNKKIFIHQIQPPVPVAPSPILTKAEYFFDTDPGVGNATTINGFLSGDSIEDFISISLDSLLTGSHYLYIRSKDAGGNWGITMQDTVDIYEVTCIVPIPNFTADTVDPGVAMTFTNLSTLDSAASYQWDIFNDSSIEYTSKNITHTFALPGIFYVKLTVKNSDSCFAFIIKKVVVGDLPLATITPAGPVYLCEGDSTTLSSADLTGNLWSTGDTSRSISVTTAGIFTVRITNSMGMTLVSDPVTVMLKDVPDISITTISANDGFPSGSASVMAIGGTGNYSYLWSNGQTTVTAIQLMPGNYFVTINDGFCQVYDTAVIGNIIGSTGVIVSAECFIDNDPGPGNGTPLTAYGDNVIEDDAVPIGYSATGHHFLYVRVKDNQGQWSITKVQHFFVYDTLQSSATFSPPIVAAEYFFDTDPGIGNGVSISVTTGDSINRNFSAAAASLDTGYHFLFVRVRDTNGSWSLVQGKKFFVFDTIGPISSPVSPPLGAAEYFFDTDPGAGNGISIPIQIGDSVDFDNYMRLTNLDTGSHFVYVRTRDIEGKWGIAIRAGFDVFYPDCIMPVVDFITDTVNFNSPTTFTNITDSVNIQTSYLWDINNDGTDDYATRDIIHSYIAPGIYQAKLTVQNNTDCIVSILKDILVGPLPDDHVTVSGNNIICAGDSVILSSTPGQIYNWSTGATAQSIVVKDGGNYWLTVTKNGISLVSDIVDITVHPAIILTLQANNTNGSNSGSIVANPSGGSSNFAYSWSNGQSTQAAVNLAAGLYSVTVNDGSCNVTSSGTVGTSVPSGIISAEYFVDADPGAGQGTPIPISAGEQIDQFAYLRLNQITSGRHYLFIRVKDENAQWSIARGKAIYVYDTSAVIGQPSAELVAAEYFLDADSGVGKGITIPIVSGDSVDKQYTFDISSLSLGNYNLYVRVMDADGIWSISSDASFAVVNCHETQVSMIDASCPGLPDGSIDLTVLGTTGPFTFQWSNGATTEDLTNVIAAIYKVTVTDADGCKTNDTAVVNAPVTMTLHATTTDASCSIADGSASVAITGGIPNYSFEWSNGQTTQTVNNLVAGNYTLTVTDNIGCAADTNVIVENTNVPIIHLTGITNNICFGGAQGAINISVTRGTPTFTFLWSNGSSSKDISGLSANQYSVTVNDNAGCTAAINALVSQPSKITTNIIAANVTVFNGSNGSANLSLSGGVPPYSYHWNNGAATQDISNVSAGEYFVTVTDNKGCIAVDSVTIIMDVSPPSCSNPIFPADGYDDAPLISSLSWSFADHAPTGYKLFIGSDSSALTPVSTSSATTYQYSLLSETVFYWKVVPYNSLGDATGCPTWSFITQAIPPACAVNVSPANSSTNLLPNTNLQWLDGGGSPSGYYVYFGTDQNNLSQYFTSSTNFLTNSLPNSTYYWKIVPNNVNGFADGCPLWSFSTINCGTTTATASGAPVICPGQSVTLTASDGSSYLWNTGEITKSISVDDPGDYFVVVNNGSGCNIQSNTVAISTEIKPQINSGGITGICQGDILQISYGSVANVLWSTGANSSTISVSPLVSTTYYVQGTTAAGCVYYDSIFISVNPLVIPGIVTNMLPVNSTVELTNPLNLSWMPGQYNTQFDLYLWDSLDVQPISATAANIASINITLNNLSYGRTYKWFIVSKNGNCFSATGPVQTFTLRKLPDLIVYDVQAPAIGYSGQYAGVTWKVKNIGDGNTINQPWGDVVYLSDDTILNGFDVVIGSARNVSYLEPTESYLSIDSFTLPNNIAGNYYIIVITGPVTESNASNNINHNFIPMQVLLTPPPDLQVTSVLSPSNGFSGTNMNVTYSVKNFGAGSTLNRRWIDRIYITQDPFLNINVTPISFNYTVIGELKPDSSYTHTLSLKIPKYIFGPFYIYVVSDATNTVFEVPFENNNTNSTVTQIFLTPPPDLRVVDITIPPTSSSSQVIQMSWSVINQGANSTELGEYWYDKVYLSNDPNLTQVNSVDETGVKNIRRDLPDTVLWLNVCNGEDIGAFYFALQQYNYSLPGENSDFLQPQPPLSAGGVASTGGGSSGGGGGGGSVSFATSCWITQVSLPEPFKSGDLFNVSKADTIPQNIPAGTYYIYVKADANEEVFEHTFEANNLKRAADPIIITNPDLVVPTVTVPTTANSGQPASISWEVKNNGIGGTYNRSRKDFIYISTSNVFNALTAILLDSLSSTESITPGNLVTKQKNVMLPNGIFGNYYAFIKTDARDSIYESNENNNINTVAPVIAVQLTPWPDLSTTSITVADTIHTIFRFSLSYQVKNIGIADLNASWNDSIFISADSVWNRETSHFVEVNHKNGILNINDSYFKSYVINLPLTRYWYCGMREFGQNPVFCNARDSSTFYIYIITDAHDLIYEYTGENNNIFRSQRIFVIDPAVDHIIESVTIADTAYSGTTVPANWKVKNLGSNTGQQSYSNWSDVLILSLDTLLSQDDIVFCSALETDPLDSLQSYTKNSNVQIPNGFLGDYFVFAFTNVNWYNYLTNQSLRAIWPFSYPYTEIYAFNPYYSISGEKDVSNNLQLKRDPSGKPKPIHILLTIPPDLKVVSVSIPPVCQAGQPAKIKYIVRNEGLGQTPTAAWNDNIYISATPGGTDHYIGSKSHYGILQPNEFYEDSIDVNLPLLNGNYYLVVYTDAKNDIYEHHNENNNSNSNLFSLFLPPPSDLVVYTIDGPDSANAGLPISLSWKIKNIGNNPAFGLMKDGVYFSKDGIWDVNDPLIATVDDNVYLPPLGEVSHAVNVDLDGVTLGYHYIVIRTDLLNNIYETNDLNNTGFSPGQIFVTVKELPLDTTIADTTIGNKKMFYRVDIDSALNNETLLVRLKGFSSTNANRLYILYEQIPTTSVYEVAGTIPFSADQEVVIPSVRPGSYYITVLNSNPLVPSNNPPHQLIGAIEWVTLRAEILPFEIRQVNSNHGGNTGSVTVQIDGSKFEPNMQIYLHSDSLNLDIMSSGSYYVNSIKLFASFNLNHKPLGKYNVVLRKLNMDSAELLNGFTIEPGDNGGFYIGGITNSGQSGSSTEAGCDPGTEEGFDGGLQLGVISPTSVRQRSPFTMTVLFGNSGNTDIPIPTRILLQESDLQIPISLTAAGIADNTHELFLDFKELNGPPGVLRPGVTGGIVIYTNSGSRRGRINFKIK